MKRVTAQVIAYLSLHSTQKVVQTSQYHRPTMDPARRLQLIKRRAVTKASLTRLQSFIELRDQKINDIQVRFNKLPDIFSKHESAQDELECLDEADHTAYREEFENQYYQVEAKFNQILHPVVQTPLSTHSSPRSSLSGNSKNIPKSHISTHIKITNHCIANI